MGIYRERNTRFQKDIICLFFSLFKLYTENKKRSKIMTTNKYQPKKGERVARHILKLLEKFPEGGMSFEELFSNYDVDKKTIFRDIDDIKKASKYMGIEFSTPGKGNTGKYKLELPYFPLLKDETVLFKYLQLQKEDKDVTGKITSEAQDMITLEQLIEQNKYLRQYIQKMIRCIIFLGPSYSKIDDFHGKVNLCVQAIDKEKKLRFFYRGEHRKVCPYGLINREYHWYLPAYCCKAKEMRMFRLDRIRSLQITSEKFNYPEDYSLEDIQKNSWSIYFEPAQELIEVKIITKGLATEELEQLTFHPSQKLSSLDGRVLATFSLETWKGMVGWILRWGDLVEVLEPVDMRDHIKEIASKMVEIYSKAGSSK